MSSCTSCGTDWSKDKFSVDCPQCGDGAMTLICLICEGHCGRMWTRAVLDSQDFNEAHWVGSCGLPKEEQVAITKKRYGASR
ncbi:MAG: hypothetical protein JRI52_05180 [Deltaproteobacteria bacterium]|nr:hypothetical protein [Deltaproteobacteria bacterium]